MYRMKLCAIFTIVLMVGCFVILAQKSVAQDGCETAFDDVRNFTADVYEKTTAEIVGGVIAWDSTDWDNIVRRVVGTSEFYLNNCIDQPLAEQPDAIAEFAKLSLIQPPLTSVDIGGDFGDLTLVSSLEPSTQWIDLNGDGVDELVLHTQVPYFSEKTVYMIQGGLSIAFFDSEDGWQGQVIAPVTSFVTTQEDGDHVSYTMTDDNTLSVQESHQSLRYFPAPTAEVFFAGEDETPLTAITLYTLTGAGEAKELNVLSWDGRIPSVELRVAFDDWCYPGRSLDWQILDDGSVFIPSNGGEQGSALHCGRTPDGLFVWQGDRYAVRGI
jgi:hypothetical protein